MWGKEPLGPWRLPPAFALHDGRLVAAWAPWAGSGKMVGENVKAKQRVRLLQKCSCYRRRISLLEIGNKFGIGVSAESSMKRNPIS